MTRGFQTTLVGISVVTLAGKTAEDIAEAAYDTPSFTENASRLANYVAVRPMVHKETEVASSRVFKLSMQLEKYTYSTKLAGKISDALRDVGSVDKGKIEFGQKNVHFPTTPAAYRGEKRRPGAQPSVPTLAELESSDTRSITMPRFKRLIDALKTDLDNANMEAERMRELRHDAEYEISFMESWIAHVPDRDLRNAAKRKEWGGRLRHDVLFSAVGYLFWDEIADGKSFDEAFEALRAVSPEDYALALMP